MPHKHIKGVKVTILIIYIGDIILTSNDVIEMEHLKGLLVKKFKIKNLGDLRYFLGVEVARSKKGNFSITMKI